MGLADAIREPAAFWRRRIANPSKFAGSVACRADFFAIGACGEDFAGSSTGCCAPDRQRGSSPSHVAGDYRRFQHKTIACQRFDRSLTLLWRPILLLGPTIWGRSLARRPSVRGGGGDALP